MQIFYYYLKRDSISQIASAVANDNIGPYFFEKGVVYITGYMSLS